MSSVTLNVEANKLEDVTDVVAVRNAKGRIIGRFFPEPESASETDLDIPFGEEELRRREQVREGFTTKQVLAYLKNLEEA